MKKETYSINKKAYMLGIVYVAAMLNFGDVFGDISLLTVVTALFSLIVVFDFIFVEKFNITDFTYFFIPLGLLLITWISVMWTPLRSITITRNYAYTILPIFFVVTHLSGIKEKDLKIVDRFVIFGSACYVAYVLFTHNGVINPTILATISFTIKITLCIVHKKN